MKENYLLIYYAISPIHAGSGDTAKVIDLPIQREKHTDYPFIQATGIKGAMREQYRNYLKDNGQKTDINKLFGYDKDDAQGGEKLEENYPGMISISDAKLLAFPMRSNIAPFIWVTCPQIIKRLCNDLYYLDIINKNEEDINAANQALIKIKNFYETEKSLEKAFVIFGKNQNFPDKVILEESVVSLEKDENKLKESMLEKLNALLSKILNSNIDKLILVSDEIFSYCINCTEIQTNISIDITTGTTKNGSLRYQEFLPSETVLYSALSFKANDDEPGKLENYKTDLKTAMDKFIQIGGDATLGKGICRIEWIESDNNTEKVKQK
jgi:CRISPR-associated protein Cmr4